jgi:hypothetical protein
MSLFKDMSIVMMEFIDVNFSHFYLTEQGGFTFLFWALLIAL